MKNKKNNTMDWMLEQFQNPIEKIMQETKLIPLSHIHVHDCSLLWFGTGTSIKRFSNFIGQA
jgi:hypothetical protein